MKHLFSLLPSLVSLPLAAAPVLVPADFAPDFNERPVPEMLRYTGTAAAALARTGQLVVTNTPMTEAEIARLPTRPVRTLVMADWPLQPASQADGAAFGDRVTGVRLWYGYVLAGTTAEAQRISEQLDQFAVALTGEWVAPPEAVVQSNRVSLGVAQPILRGGYR
ncbi:hypothetical protein ACTSKR_13325 [Chitinibacteraceae bacterium HSL-7]